MNTRSTRARLDETARLLGATIEESDEAYEALAPEGKMWAGEELQTLVEVYTSVPGSYKAAWKTEAMLDLTTRMRYCGGFVDLREQSR